jgi:pimeloyl-ACP methyl ester carboxylesterase
LKLDWLDSLALQAKPLLVGGDLGGGVVHIAADIGEHWTPYVTHGAAAALMRQIHPLTASDTKEISGRLHTLGLPARVVWGEADGFQKIEFGERLAAELGCDIIRIPKGKHFTPEDHPVEVAAAINSLLSES